MKSQVTTPTLSGHLHQRKSRLHATLVISFVCLFLLHQLNQKWGSEPSVNKEAFPLAKPFKWNELVPSRRLEFTACYDGLECARLDVPLDWKASSKSGGHRAAIALAKLPAKVPVTDPRYGGAVLLNPGGPGGSGVNLVSRKGTHVQPIIDSELDPLYQSKESNAKYFDVIGFDPRGVNFSTPSASCFPDDTAAQAWALMAQAQGDPFTNESFSNTWSRTTSMARSCSWRLSSTADDILEIGKYMSTPNVVEDMVAITEALGEWREAEAEKLLAGTVVDTAVREHTRWRKGEEKLLYWGFSYGTLLGATFAAMHPERVGRLVLDGVVDADDYYAGEWMTNLQDTDSIVDSFFEECYAAGPDKCALYSAHGPKRIAKAFHDTFQELFKGPIPVPAHDVYGPDIVTYHDAMMILTRALYDPREGFPRLARIVHDLSKGNGTELAALKQKLRPGTCKSPVCDNKPWSPTCYDHGSPAFSQGASSAVLCSDGEDAQWKTQADHRARWEELKKQSFAFAGYWSQIQMPCSNWGIRPAWDFTLNISAATTAHPIVFLSTTRDPVTPLRNAVKMSKRFGGSVVFGQDADGHCTISQPSECVAKGVRRYFQTGQLPVGGMACKPDVGPFDRLPDEKGLYSELSMAIKRLSRGIHQGSYPLGI